MSDCADGTTFRDPEGFCARIGDRIFRIIYAEAEPRIRSLLSSDFVRGVLEEGLIPSTRVLPGEETSAILSHESVRWRLSGRQVGLVLEHRRIEFESGPHEWCPEMLFAAGELTLQLQLRALDAGLTLKDATPSNVLFDGPRPVFIDLLSFAPRPKGMTIWTGYAQFVRTFVLPLFLYRSKRIAPHTVFFTRRDGLEPEEVYHQLSLLERFGWSALQYVTLPTLLGRRCRAQEVAPADTIHRDDERALSVVRLLVQGLGRVLRRMRPVAVRRSQWSEYMHQKTYDENEFAAKEAFVASSLRRLAPASVLDAGCNTGHFARLAADLGASVVGMDYDPVVVGQLWSQAQAGKQNILPLVMNLARPSPGLGWRNAETTSFLDRAAGKFEVALLLAVIHHVSVTDGVPLPDVFQLVSGMVTLGAIVEYVPPTDPMFRTIARNKEHLIPGLEQEDFEAAFRPWFEALKVESLGSGRRLYCLRKLPKSLKAPPNAL